ncbi:MAG TPA: Gfo/Idh/MocA family oxidoreductase [Candidatus Cybelea sp.]|nr:Gfo/Idh/MocA family oxidoreductase [Candidatus Cybelea sp.]
MTSAETQELPSEDAYALVSAEAKPFPAPDLPYQPPMPRDRSIPIGLIGAGGISFAHLDAYRAHGLNVVAICDRHLDRAQARRDAYYPKARATDRIEDVLGNPDIRVLDLTVHAKDRVVLMRAALEAGQHVLSQKPFVRDLDVGRALVDLAAAKGLQLAVNQNGRWAPHLSYIREAVSAGLIGAVTGVHVSIQWDHSWIAGTPFAVMEHVILDDFAIHWFDFLVSIIGDRARTVYATAARAEGQHEAISSPLLSQAMVSFPSGQASLVFDANATYGAQDTTTVVGTRGTLRSTGPDLGRQSVCLYKAEGVAQPALTGKWFNDGFAGTMGALLCAIETGEEPINSARGNLAALGLSQAAIQSTRTGVPVSFG